MHSVDGWDKGVGLEFGGNIYLPTLYKSRAKNDHWNENNYNAFLKKRNITLFSGTTKLRYIPIPAPLARSLTHRVAIVADSSCAP